MPPRDLSVQAHHPGEGVMCSLSVARLHCVSFFKQQLFMQRSPL